MDINFNNQTAAILLDIDMTTLHHSPDMTPAQIYDMIATSYRVFSNHQRHPSFKLVSEWMACYKSCCDSSLFQKAYDIVCDHEQAMNALKALGDLSSTKLSL